MNFEVLLLETLRGIEIIAGWWILFCLCSKPPDKVRYVILVVSFVVCYVFWYLVPLDVMFAPGTELGKIMHGDVANAILWAIIIVYFALISGDARNSLITALYYIGMEQCFDVLRVFINRAINGYYVRNYMQYNIEYLVLLGWAYFYYSLIRKHRGAMPWHTLILTLIMPAGSFVILTYYIDISRVLGTGTVAWLRLQQCGIILGIFLIALNLIMFYLYVKLLVSRDAKTFAMEVAKTPPVWTSEKGVSEEFIKKYGLSKREKEVIEAFLTGRSYKEISEKLFVSYKTVETHLRNIYKKTNTGSRFALYALIKG